MTTLLISCSTPSSTSTYNPVLATPVSKNLKQDHSKSIAPTWFTQELKNNDLYLYGTGSADSYKKATNQALADMIQKLQVTVSSNTSLQTISLNDNISQKLVQEISTQTAKINIPNYKIINQSQSNGTFYIQLQINTNETINSLQQIIASLLKESLFLSKNAENKNSLTKFTTAQKLEHKTEEIKNSLRTLIILNPNINIKQQMIQLNEVENQILNLKRNITITIDNENGGYFYHALEKYLSTHNFHISNQKLIANIIILIKLLDYDNETRKDEYCITSKVELQASDTTSAQLAPKVYKISACSKKGRQDTLDKASEIFYSQLNEASSIY